jgi:hypothetical protein
MAAAQQFEAEQTGETFLRSFKTIAKHKSVVNPKRKR